MDVYKDENKAKSDEMGHFLSTKILEDFFLQIFRSLASL